ncbi:MAG: cupin domain-containing protein [Planctomycetota bacterium]
MKHVHYDKVAAQPTTEAGAEGVNVRWLISEDDGAPHFYMRRFEVEPGGRTPHHSHAWEHEVYVLEGKGTLHCEGGEYPFEPDDVIFLAPGEKHYFAADGSTGAVFLCLIPRQQP